MRTLTLILVLSVSLAFAGALYTDAPADLGQVVPGGGYTCLPPPSNDILWENPFEFALCTNGYNSSDGYRCADDFVLDDDATIEGFTCWSIFTGGHPQPFEVTVWVDSGGAPGAEQWSETVSDITDTDTGYTGWGYQMFQTDMVLDSSFDLSAGTYWVEFFWTSTYFYWLVENGGNLRQNGAPQGVSGFFAINGFEGEPDTIPPIVSGMDPDDGEIDVPLDSNIVFLCVDEAHSIDLDTIDFTARDTSLQSDRALGLGSPNRTIDGDLDVDDADPVDVVCTFDPTDDFTMGDTITNTVAAGLADSKGNEMADDFVWVFDVEGAVTTTTWGAIKAVEF